MQCTTAFQPADRQPAYSGAAVAPRGYMNYSRGEFEVAGRELYEGEYRNYFNADEFETVNGAMRQRGAGKGLMIAGGATLGVGLALFIPGYISMSDPGQNFWTVYLSLIHHRLAAAVPLPRKGEGTSLKAPHSGPF